MCLSRALPLIILAGCAGPDKVFVPVCVRPKDYGREFERAVIDELRDNPVPRTREYVFGQIEINEALRECDGGSK